MEHDQNPATAKPARRLPWNKGKLVGPKPPLQPSHVWSIRTKLQIEDKKRDLALFNLAIDSKLRGCDLVAVKITDVWSGDGIATRAIVVQKRPAGPSSSKSLSQPAMPSKHG